MKIHKFTEIHLNDLELLNSKLYYINQERRNRED